MEVTATASFVQPGGRECSIPLFWDGGAQWKVRFSPDAVGAWHWSIRSNDPGLDGAEGSFNCVSSTNHGGITAMAGYPYHFQYQDGTPYEFFTRSENGSRREWWKLESHDELVSSQQHPDDGTPGHAYCLADPGQNYIVYTENTRATDLKLEGAPDATYRVTRFDPRTAIRTTINASVKNGIIFTLLSPNSEDWVFEVQRK